MCVCVGACVRGCGCVCVCKKERQRKTILKGIESESRFSPVRVRGKVSVMNRASEIVGLKVRFEIKHFQEILYHYLIII